MGKPYDGESMLHLAAREGATELFRELTKSQNPNQINGMGETPLHVMVYYYARTIRTLRTLLKCGANPNARDVHGVTPLMLAAHYWNPNAIKVLVNHGALLNTYDSNDHCCLAHAIQGGSPCNIETLIAMGANPHRLHGMGRNLVHVAAEAEMVCVLNTLAKQNLEMDRKDLNGMTPLTLALIKANNSRLGQRFPTVETLLSWGANPVTALEHPELTISPESNQKLFYLMQKEKTKWESRLLSTVFNSESL